MALNIAESSSEVDLVEDAIYLALEEQGVLLTPADPADGPQSLVGPVNIFRLAYTIANMMAQEDFRPWTGKSNIGD